MRDIFQPNRRARRCHQRTRNSKTECAKELGTFLNVLPAGEKERARNQGFVLHASFVRRGGANPHRSPWIPREDLQCMWANGVERGATSDAEMRRIDLTSLLRLTGCCHQRRSQ